MSRTITYTQGKDDLATKAHVAMARPDGLPNTFGAVVTAKIHGKHGARRKLVCIRHTGRNWQGRNNERHYAADLYDVEVLFDGGPL